MVVTDSKKTAIEIHLGLQHRFPDKRLLLYTGDTDAEIKKRDFTDVNASWATADAVIYTSTCEAGISCTIPGFEDVFAFHVGNVIGVQPFLQMMGRNRVVKRLHVYVRESKDGGVCEVPLTRDDIFEEYRCAPTSCFLVVYTLLLLDSDWLHMSFCFSLLITIPFFLASDRLDMQGAPPHVANSFALFLLCKQRRLRDHRYPILCCSVGQHTTQECIVYGLSSQLP